MNTKSLIQIPGYNYNEYLLILNPHEELRNKIIHVKKEFHEKYQAENALWGKPHLTLVNFVQFEMMEERLVSRLKTIGMGYTPFKVELKDFGSFPSHTIFINVDSKLQVKNLSRELRLAQKLMTLNKDNKPHFIDDPYITIARRLLPWQYEQGWLDYSHRHFTGRFIADSMLLLKRKVGNKAYQIVQRFEFMNLPVTTKQGDLFI
ncbi:MAG: 2'-5' RNA ligase family protein [Ginsengibacter sp.]